MIAKFVRPWSRRWRHDTSNEWDWYTTYRACDAEDSIHREWISSQWTMIYGSFRSSADSHYSRSSVRVGASHSCDHVCQCSTFLQGMSMCDVAPHDTTVDAATVTLSLYYFGRSR